MEKTIILISRNKKESDRIAIFLLKNHYHLDTITSLDALAQFLSPASGNCVILDLDSVYVDNRAIRELALRYPHICFLCMSSDRFHPELKDAIGYHIYACLTKPLNHDELLYWLRCIEDNNNDAVENNNYQ